ncbi:hypothetical protein INR49_009449 [Caranx melampygus]|nr:hypothetical protein INR49_009449 [Caranx melampygus]
MFVLLSLVAVVLVGFPLHSPPPLSCVSRDHTNYQPDRFLTCLQLGENVKEPKCDDRGESSEGVVSVLEGQAGWLSCPLFSHPSVYNYTSTQSARHNLSWYCLTKGHYLEQPILYSSRLSQDRERLWLEPAVAEDTGQYICMLRNKSSCSKITMLLKVVKLDEVAWEPTWQAPVAVVTTNVNIPLQEGKTLECSSPLPKEPSILHPTAHHVFTVKQGRHIESNLGDRTEESVLVIQDFQSEDLNREYNCSVRNERGFETHRAQLEEEVSLPLVELGCGLGVMLVLMLIVFVVYHVFWLELLLLYRSWFGTEERHTDDKQYDVYISYARNSEEEQFVLTTLRRVLENELGYSVCIFDRDSLPGGTITDETLSFVARSRRLLVVISPGYASKGSQALLELKAGIDGMALDGHLRVILVQYKPVHRQGWVKELRQAWVALALVQWQGTSPKS